MGRHRRCRAPAVHALRYGLPPSPPLPPCSSVGLGRGRRGWCHGEDSSSTHADPHHLAASHTPGPGQGSTAPQRRAPRTAASASAAAGRPRRARAGRALGTRTPARPRRAARCRRRRRGGRGSRSGCGVGLAAAAEAAPHRRPRRPTGAAATGRAGHRGHRQEGAADRLPLPVLQLVPAASSFHLRRRRAGAVWSSCAAAVGCPASATVASSSWPRWWCSGRVGGGSPSMRPPMRRAGGPAWPSRSPSRVPRRWHDLGARLRVSVR